MEPLRLLDFALWVLLCGAIAPVIASKLQIEINVRLYIFTQVVFLMGFVTPFIRMFS